MIIRSTCTGFFSVDRRGLLSRLVLNEQGWGGDRTYPSKGRPTRSSFGAQSPNDQGLLNSAIHYIRSVTSMCAVSSSVRDSRDLVADS